MRINKIFCSATWWRKKTSVFEPLCLIVQGVKSSVWIQNLSLCNLTGPVLGGDETRLGYVRYVQDIQPNVPAHTMCRHGLYVEVAESLVKCLLLGFKYLHIPIVVCSEVHKINRPFTRKL